MPTSSWAWRSVYHQQGKSSQAIVIVEDLCRRRDTPAAAHVLYATLLLAEGDVRGAVAQYKLGIEADPQVADAQLGRALGIGAGCDDGEVVAGRVRETWQEPLAELRIGGGTTTDHVRARRWHAASEGGDQRQDPLSAAASGNVPGVRQSRSAVAS